MKKLILSAVMMTALGIVVPAAQAKTTAAPSVGDPQVRIQIGGRQRNRRVRTVTSTRVVGVGRNRVRETIRTTYYPNGRRVVKVIKRQRIGWNHRG